VPEHIPTGTDSYIRLRVRAKGADLKIQSAQSSQPNTIESTIASGREAENMDDELQSLSVIGDELQSLVPCVGDVTFPGKWMLRKVVAAATPLPPLIPLLAGTERFAPSWVPQYHAQGHAQRSYDVSCYFARNASVLGIGNLLVDDRLITSPEFMPDYWRQALEADTYAGTRRERRLRQRTIEDRTIVAGGWGIHVYGHFLIEMLPRLWVARKALGTEVVNYKVLLDATADRWLLTILTGTLGFSSSQLVFYQPEEEQLLIQEAVLPTLASFNTHFHPVWNDLIDELVRDTRRYSGIVLSRVYLLRPTAANPASPRRTCINEARLAEIATTEFGFTAIAPETLSWPIQVNIFHNAEVIAGAFGSGLHNAIFSKAGTRIGSIGMNNLTQTLIGALRDHRNAYLKASPSENGEFEIDEDEFRDFLEALLGN